MGDILSSQRPTPKSKFLSLKIKGDIMINPKSVALVLFVMAFAFASVNLQAAPGDISFEYAGSFVDNASGITYGVQIQANEYATEAGVGDVFFQLNGPPGHSRLSLITVGKGFEPPPPSDYRPLALIKAGKPSNQAVDIDANVVEISAHAFVHSDAPNKIVFIGPVTVDVRVENKAGKIRVVISTPKGQIKLEGKLF
jgi:hypothetical protein